MQKGMEIDELGQHLMALEQKYHFQWFWLSEDNWGNMTEMEFDFNDAGDEETDAVEDSLSVQEGGAL